MSPSNPVTPAHASAFRTARCADFGGTPSRIFDASAGHRNLPATARRDDRNTGTGEDKINILWLMTSKPSY